MKPVSPDPKILNTHEMADIDNDDYIQKTESAAAIAFKSRETTLRSRISELETVIESQLSTIEKLRSDRASAEREASVRLQVKDALVQSYEKKISELQKEFHDKVFGAEEQKWMEQVHTLRMEVEALRGQNLDLKNK